MNEWMNEWVKCIRTHSIPRKICIQGLIHSLSVCCVLSTGIGHGDLDKTWFLLSWHFRLVEETEE